MVKAKKIPFINSYIITHDELWRLNLVLNQIDNLHRWLGKDKRAMLIVESLKKAAECKYFKEPYEIRDELLKLDCELPTPTKSTKQIT